MEINALAYRVKRTSVNITLVTNAFNQTHSKDFVSFYSKIG